MGDFPAMKPVSPPVLVLDDVTLTYEAHPAVHHLSGTFARGCLTAIVGPNGAGKSTLLKAIMGQLPLSHGTIDRCGLAIGDFGYLPQAAELDRHFPLSVADLVMLGAWREVGVFGRVTSACAEAARQALVAVGLEGFEVRSIGSLSSGQFQRVLFARLILQNASVIILDEPFTAIDARTTEDLLRIIAGWHGEGRTVIAVLHDFDQVRHHFPETLLLARDLIGWGPTVSVLTEANLQRTRAMAEKWDESAPYCAA